MSWSNRTYGDVACTNTGDIDEPLKGYAQRKVVDECWCGARKHVEWNLCSICQVVLAKDPTE